MLQLIVILAVAYIVVPLIDLFSSPRAATISKAVVYIITLLWLVGILFFHRGVF